MNIELFEELARLRAAFKLLKEVVKKSEVKSRFSDGSLYRELSVDRNLIKYVFLVAGETDKEEKSSEKEGVDVCTLLDE